MQNNQPNKKKQNYWFPRKTYGWGWGFPCSWQGWVVMIIYVISLIVLPNVISPSTYTFYQVVIGLSALLIGICIWKGEPSKWQWHNKNK